MVAVVFGNRKLRPPWLVAVQKTMTVLETERLLLREWRPEDWLAFRPIATDPDVMRYITDGVAWTDGQIQRFVTRQINNAERDDFCLWKLVDKANARLVGFCGLQPLGTTDEIEIGWWLARDCWGRGLATEAARSVVDFGFGTAKLARIVAIARPENNASRNIMHKLGMTFVRETDTGEMGKQPPVVKLVYYSLENSAARTESL